MRSGSRPKRSKTAAALARIFKRTRGEASAISPAMPTPQILEERLRGLEKRIDELTTRVNGLLFALGAAIAIQVLLGITKH